MGPDDNARPDAVITAPSGEAFAGRFAKEAWVGFVLGLFGFLLAVWAFVYVGLFTGRADPHDQLGAGLSAAEILGAISLIAVVVTAVRTRRRSAARAYGLLIGLLVGVLLHVHLHVVVVPVMNDLPGGCNCDPLIEQLRPGDP
jgi:hypothetical protein